MQRTFGQIMQTPSPSAPYRPAMTPEEEEGARRREEEKRRRQEAEMAAAQQGGVPSMEGLSPADVSSMFLGIDDLPEPKTGLEGLSSPENSKMLAQAMFPKLFFASPSIGMYSGGP
jgi:hypothetical protein